MALREGGAKLDELINILIKNIRLKDPAVYRAMVWPGLNPNGYANKETIIEIQDYFLKTAVVKQRVPTEEVVDDSFVNYALSVLGKI